MRLFCQYFPNLWRKQLQTPNDLFDNPLSQFNIVDQFIILDPDVLLHKNWYYLTKPSITQLDEASIKHIFSPAKMQKCKSQFGSE